MTTPHIEAHVGAYHETVLMPGDPLRAKWIAENLDKYEVVNKVRNCLGYSGTYKGRKYQFRQVVWDKQVLESMLMNYTMFIMLKNYQGWKLWRYCS